MKKTTNDIDSLAPFYPSHPKHKMSTEIISEARASIGRDVLNRSDSVGPSGGGSSALRTLGTQRPFTPRDRQRTLFGKVGRASRPPSAVNLKYLQNQSADVLKNSYAKKKNFLTPVKGHYNVSFDELQLSAQNLENIDEKPELPTLQKNRKYDAKSKSVDLELETDRKSSGLKLKLPSLHGLAKPLHRRRDATNVQHGEAEEKSDKNVNHSITGPSAEEKLAHDQDGASEENLYVKDILYSEDLHSLFSKRRLFGESKSISEDARYSASEVDNVGSSASSISNEPTPFSASIQSPQPKTVDFQLPSKHVAKRPMYFDILDNLSNKESQFLPEEDIVEMFLILYDTLEKEMEFQDISGEEKAMILKVVYKYIESSNEALLISMARIILALRVTGSNLSGVCKLIFKIARNDKNDHLFLNNNLLDLFIVGLGRAEPLHDAECLVYGYGALKFLGMNSTLLEHLRPLGVLPLMTLHIKMFNEARSENSHSVGEQGCHGLYQLTGALRNMAGNDGFWNSTMTNDKFSNVSTPCNNLLDFIAEGTLREVCRTIELFSDDLDIEINAARTLSVLSADFECCINLCEQKNILSAIVKLLETYTDKTPLIVRLTYILGNMMACNNDIRLDLYNEVGSVKVFMKILNFYFKKSWSNTKIDSAENIIIGSDLDGSNGSDEDVMVKAVRVIANMCINSTVGTYFAQAEKQDDNVLAWILKCIRQYSQSDSVELVTSALATLNNISYYHSDEFVSSIFLKLQIEFCEALCNLLSYQVSPYTTETLRVLGNMSRTKATIEYIVTIGALPNIIQLTKSNNNEISVAAAGVLINLVAHDDARTAWFDCNGMTEAISALQTASDNHRWQLAQLLCQALWNASPLPNAEISLLSPLLIDILDEQHVFGTTDSAETRNSVVVNDDKYASHEGYLSIRLAWEDFAIVAVNLLEKIDPLINYE